MTRRKPRPRHTVTVSIAGEKHVLRSDAPPEYTRAVAEHVDRTVSALGDKQPLQPHRTAILAALFITDELFRARRELEQLREVVGGRAQALAERLERAVRPSPPADRGESPSGDGARDSGDVPADDGSVAGRGEDPGEEADPPGG
jgi:cell division protein ZapA